MPENRIEQSVERLRECLSDATLADVEKHTQIDVFEHGHFQDVQTWAHASGVINYDEAQTMYDALGPAWSHSNGGWADGVETAMKVVVTQLVAELMSARRAAAVRDRVPA